MPALPLQHVLKPKPQRSFWVLVVSGEEELLERVFVIGSFWPGSWWYLPCGLHALVTPPLEWDLLLRTRIQQSDKVSLLWLDYKDCDFHLVGGLYCLLSLYPLIEQAAMLARPMGQGTRDSLWLTAHGKLNSADNHVSELGSRFFTSWAMRWLHLQPTSWLQPVRDPDSADLGPDLHEAMRWQMFLFQAPKFWGNLLHNNAKLRVCCWKTAYLGATNSYICISFLPFKTSPLLMQL